MDKGENYNPRFLPGQLAQFQTAINVFNRQIELGNYTDYSIWNNRGILKLNLGIAKEDVNLIFSAYHDFETVINSTKENNPDEYELAKEIIALAQKAITAFSNR